jgi:hypothetical protein
VSAIRPGTCGDPGPGDAHCTDDLGHHYSCYDADDNVAFNARQEFTHECRDERCDRQHFVNEKR